MPVHQSPRFQPADCRKGRCLVPVYFDDEAKKRADGGTASRVIRRPEDRGSEVRSASLRDEAPLTVEKRYRNRIYT